MEGRYDQIIFHGYWRQGTNNLLSSRKWKWKMDIYGKVLFSVSNYLDRWISFSMILGEKLERDKNLEKKRKFSREKEKSQKNEFF